MTERYSNAIVHRYTASVLIRTEMILLKSLRRLRKWERHCPKLQPIVYKWESAHRALEDTPFRFPITVSIIPAVVTEHWRCVCTKPALIPPSPCEAALMNSVFLTRRWVYWGNLLEITLVNDGTRVFSGLSASKHSTLFCSRWGLPLRYEEGFFFFKVPGSQVTDAGDKPKTAQQAAIQGMHAAKARRPSQWIHR